MADKINTEILQRAFESIRDERAKGANTARRIGDAFLSTNKLQQGISGILGKIAV